MVSMLFCLNGFKILPTFVHQGKHCTHNVQTAPTWRQQWNQHFDCGELGTRNQNPLVQIPEHGTSNCLTLQNKMNWCRKWSSHSLGSFSNCLICAPEKISVAVLHRHCRNHWLESHSKYGFLENQILWNKNRTFSEMKWCCDSNEERVGRI